MSEPGDTVLVTGGTGTLGRSVVAELTRRGLAARVLSRSVPPRVDGPVSVVTGDLASGRGVAAAVEGVSAVIHCATGQRHAQRVDVEGTRRLVFAVAARAPQAHLVYISIVGAERNPLRYYRAKVQAEQIVGSSAGPVSVVRATQFHQLVAGLCRRLVVGPVGVAFAGVEMQPCDPRFVAGQLVDTAVGPPLPDVLEVAGPERLAIADALRATAARDGRRVRWVLTAPPLGGVLRALAGGSNLPSGDAVTGGPSYREWLRG